MDFWSFSAPGLLPWEKLGGAEGTRTPGTCGLLDLSREPARPVNNATPPSLPGRRFVFQGVQCFGFAGTGAGGLIVATSLMTWSKPPARGNPARN